MDTRNVSPDDQDTEKSLFLVALTLAVMGMVTLFSVRDDLTSAAASFLMGIGALVTMGVGTRNRK